MIRFIWYLEEGYHTQHVGDGAMVNLIIVLKYLDTKVLKLARNARNSTKFVSSNCVHVQSREN